MNNNNNNENNGNQRSAEEIERLARALEQTNNELQRLRAMVSTTSDAALIPVMTSDIPMPPLTVSKKKENLPERKKLEPTRKLQKKLHFQSLNNYQVVKSNFWTEVLKQNYDLIITETDLQELQIDICKGAKKINYDGYWYIESPGNVKYVTTKKNKVNALVSTYDSHCDYFYVAGNQINYISGRRNSYIKHNKQYDDYNVIDASNIKGLDTDCIVWQNKFSAKKIVWKRYSPVLCIWDHYGDLLTADTYDVIQDFVGIKSFMKKSVPKETKFAQRVIFEESRERNVQCHLRSLKISRPSDFIKLRKVIWTMDENVMGRINPGILGSVCPTLEELSILQTMQYSRKHKATSTNVTNTYKPTMVEAFFDSVKDIPMLKQRLTDWQFKLDFDTDCTFIEENVAKVQKAVKVLQNSENFKAFMGMFLTIHNFTMNKRSNKYSYGFNIASNSYYGHKCVMEFVVRFCQDKYPYVLDWVKEFDVLDRSVISLISKYGDVIYQYQNLENKVRAVERRVSNYVGGKSEFSDGYIKLVQPFIQSSKLRLRILSTAMSTLVKECREFDEDVFGKGAFQIDEPDNTKRRQYGYDFAQGYSHIYELKLKLRNCINAVNNVRIHENKKFKLYQMKAELREIRKMNRMNKQNTIASDDEEEEMVKPKLRKVNFPSAKDKLFFDEDVLFDWQETRTKILNKKKDCDATKTKTNWRCVVIDDLGSDTSESKENSDSYIVVSK